MANMAYCKRVYATQAKSAAAVDGLNKRTPKNSKKRAGTAPARKNFLLI